MLYVRFSCNDGNLHVGYRGTRQHADVRFLFKMGEYQPLPVDVEVVLAAVGVVLQPRARFAGLKQQVDLRVMPQRLVVTDALDGRRDGFLIRDAALVERHIKPVTFLYHGGEDFKLYLAHKPDVNFFQLFVPDYAQHGVLVAEGVQLCKRGGNIGFWRQYHSIAEHRLQQGSGAAALGAQTLTRAG